MKNILVRAPNWIGDQILAYPFFHYLRESFVGARIGVACVPWVEPVQFRNLVDEMIVLPVPSRQESWLDRVRTIEQGACKLREKGSWDIGICLPNSFSSAWLFFRAGVHLRRGYRSEGRGFLLTDGVARPAQDHRHRAQEYLDLLPNFPNAPERRRAQDFWQAPQENETHSALPGIVPRFDADKAWPTVQPIQPPPCDFWVLAPGSMAESRRWMERNFQELAARIARETGWQGVIVGGAADAEIAARLCENPELKLLDYTAKGPVSALWRLFSEAQFTVANDSGLAHIASLCGSSVYVVWGGGDPKKTAPIGPGRVQIELNPISCWPCERNLCALPENRKVECLRGIAPETVWDGIKSGVRLQNLHG